MRYNRIILRITILVAIFPFSIIGQRACSDKNTIRGWRHESIDPALPGTSWGTSAFTLADYDGDGDLDITISRREINGGQVYWYRNHNGKWEQYKLGISDQEQQSAAVTDINGDGFKDLVVSRFWFENPKVLDKKPDSAWFRRAYAGGLPSENHDVVSFDFNNDGKEEIAAYSQKSGDGTIRIYDVSDFNNWRYFDVTTTHNQTVNYLDGSNGVHGGFAPHGIGDLDGDGYGDIVMPAGWYQSPGKNYRGVWEFHPWSFKAGIAPNLYGVSIRSWVADLDADGDNDIVYTDCDVEGSKAYWIRNRGNGRFDRHTLPLPAGPTGSLHSLVVADFDNDGDMDIMSGEQEDPDPGMKPKGLRERGFFWQNTGYHRRPSYVLRIINTDNPGWHDAKAGDVDGDHDLDVVSKVWNKDGRYYHADLWVNQLDLLRKKN